jgi:hypothetical protein
MICVLVHEMIALFRSVVLFVIRSFTVLSMEKWSPSQQMTCGFSFFRHTRDIMQRRKAYLSIVDRERGESLTRNFPPHVGNRNLYLKVSTEVLGTSKYFETLF